jgi:ATP synthase protein I
MKGFFQDGSGKPYKITYNRKLCCLKVASRTTMTKAPLDRKKHSSTDVGDGAREEQFQPLSAEQAQLWRQSQPLLSVWRVLAAQTLTAVLLATVFALWFGSGTIWLSWMYGAFTVVIPAALFARGLTSQAASLNAMTAAMSFAVWQGVKWVLAVLLLVLAPRVFPELSWPAVLAGLIVTMKVYWLALIWDKPKTASESKTAL